jgi:hypothetical protein
MNRKSKAFGYHVNPSNFGQEIELMGVDVVGPYEGKIWAIQMKNDPGNEYSTNI